jgi:hypothetical protein
MVVWGPNERLCGLGLAVTTSKAVCIRFVAGDAREGCPLIGKRGLIILECSALYAQARGREELRVEPATSSLEALYSDIYGFERVEPNKASAYYRKAV